MVSDAGSLAPVPYDLIARAPKVLLHDHLDGGLRPETIIELAQTDGYDGLPTTDPEALGRWFIEAADSGSLERYLETFRYHGLRGVQLESVYAGLIMLLRPFGVSMRVEESFGSTNLASSATGLVKQLSPVLFVLACGGMAFLRRFSADGRGALALSLLFMLAFMLTNRVFSPQYLIWIGAPLCVLAAEAPRPAWGFWLFLGAVFLSQLIFPRGYPILKALHPLGILLLNLRNFSLIAFGLWFAGRTSTGPDSRSVGA